MLLGNLLLSDCLIKQPSRNHLCISRYLSLYALLFAKAPAGTSTLFLPRICVRQEDRPSRMISGSIFFTRPGPAPEWDEDIRCQKSPSNPPGHHGNMPAAAGSEGLAAVGSEYICEGPCGNNVMDLTQSLSSVTTSDPIIFHYNSPAWLIPRLGIFRRINRGLCYMYQFRSWA